MSAPAHHTIALRFVYLLIFALFFDPYTPAQQPAKPHSAGDVALPQKMSERPIEKSPEHAETPESLLQLNAALEGLASRVSQGVV